MYEVHKGVLHAVEGQVAQVRHQVQVEQEGALKLCEARGVSAHTAKVKEGGDVF